MFVVVDEAADENNSHEDDFDPVDDVVEVFDVVVEGSSTDFLDFFVDFCDG